jgi:hypothetical protein
MKLSSGNESGDSVLVDGENAAGHPLGRDWFTGDAIRNRAGKKPLVWFTLRHAFLID